MQGRTRRFAAAIALTATAASGALITDIQPAAAVSGPLCASVSQIAPGQTHAFALKDDTTAYGWGDNSNLQLTLAGNAKRLSPEATDALTTASEIAAGSVFTVARFPTGSVKSAGDNTYGQLGNGTTTDSRNLVDTGLANVVDVDAGAYHAIALKSDGTVWTWGRNVKGELGDSTTTSRTSPTQVPTLTNVAAIAAGWQHSLALKTDGTVWAWGNNFDGQLGDATKVDRHSPVQVSGITSANPATLIDGGATSSIALLQDKTVRTWGANGSGQLGYSSGTKTTPHPVGLANVTDVSLGSFHVVARTQDGKTWAWGSNQYGQLGTGSGKVGPPVDSPPAAKSTTPVEVATAANAQDVAANGHSSYAIRGAKTLWAWGSNASGQLGIGTTADAFEPKQSGCPTGDLTAPAWSVALAAEPPVAAPGSPITLHAVANQDVAASPYAIQIFDDQTGLLVKSCATGMTCSAPVVQATPGTRSYTAYIASPSATAPPAFTQAQASTTVMWGPTGPGPQSASCDAGTTVHQFNEGGTTGYVKTHQPSPDETAVCFRLNNGTAWVGGRVPVTAPSVLLSTITVDSDTDACNKPGNEAPGSHPVITDPGYTVDVYAKGTTASVCITVGTDKVRVGVTVPTALAPGITPSLDGA